MPHLDMGNVPAWLTAGSLALAYRTFRGSRATAERTQVDRLGIWGTVDAELSDEMPGALKTPIPVGITLRNATDLPIRIRQIGYSLHTHWQIPDAEQTTSDLAVHSIVPGKDLGARHFPEHISLAPQETREIAPSPGDVSAQAPSSEGVVSFAPPPRVVINWALVVDNAGRRWVLRPEVGGRAERVGRRWKREEYQPHDW